MVELTLALRTKLAEDEASAHPLATSDDKWQRFVGEQSLRSIAAERALVDRYEATSPEDVPDDLEFTIQQMAVRYGIGE